MIRVRTRCRSGGSAWYKSAQYLLNNVYPTLIHDYSRGQYYNASSGSTAIPFSPTRTTNATMFNSEGNMVWAPANIYTRSDVGDAGWTPSSATANIDSSVSTPTGTVVRKIVTNNAVTVNGNDSVGGIVAPTLTVVAGATYAFSFYAKAGEIGSVRVRESTVTGTRVTVDLTTGVVVYESGSSSLTNMIVSSTDAGGGWRRILCRRTASGTSQSMNIKPGNTTGDGVSGIYVTSAQCELDDTTSPKAYVATSGGAYYGHRFDYNPLTLNARGILCEPAGTNLAPNSRNASYVGDTVFGTASAAPTALLGFGGTRFTGDGTANQHYITTPATASAPAAVTVHTISAYVKAGTATLIQLTTSINFAAADVYANFNLSTGVTGSSGAGASNVTIIDCGGGIYRVALTFTTSAVPAVGGGVIVAAISATTDTRLPSFASSGTFDVMGLQLETGVSYTSLVPTYGVAATRSSETFNSAIGISGWFDNTKGVVYAEYEVYAIANRTDHFFAICAGAFSVTNTLVFISGFGTPTSRRFDSWVAGVNQASTVANDALGVTNKIAGRYTAGTTTIKGFENGVSYGTNTLAPIAAGMDRFYLSHSGLASESAIWIKSIRYYPDDTASDAQMQALTT